MKEQKGITLVALIITIIVMLILAAVTIHFGTNLLDKSKKEDLKTTMLLIQSKTKIIKEKKDFGDIEELTGISLANNTEYTISENFQNKLDTIENADLYILNSENLTNMGITENTSNEEFYIVDYNNSEIYYSLGYKEGNSTLYSLSELGE
ncbi:MAG: hypothetical protein IJN50_04680 [Clostridia bacterium]|nr:hypothetical protein [Clostridia bacterium]